MKKLIFLPFLFLSVSLFGTIHYVSTTGTDSGNALTIGTAWRTWHYAFNNTPPSDTCYFRGGVYPAYSTSIGVQLHDNSQDGTYSHPTCFFAYPADWAAGNYPVLDCQSMTQSNNMGLSLMDCHNLYIKGLTVKNTRQITGVGNAWRISVGTESYGHKPNNIRFENCIAHNSGGRGFSLSGFDTLYFENCDSYMNCDTLTSPDHGGTGVGFEVSQGNSLECANSYVTFHGCRAWKNSDQGWSINYSGRAVIDSCWSIHNGGFNMGLSKGSGFKFWFALSKWKNLNVVQIDIHNCIVADNEYYGFNWCDWNDPSLLEVRSHIYNNFAYRNGKLHPSGWTGGFGFCDDVNTDSTGRYDHWYWNNLSYDNYGGPTISWPQGDKVTGAYHQATNKFDLTGTTISSEDFVNLDTTGLCGARQTGGELPITTFGYLASTSECINAGTNVGLPYEGSPDIGWIEFDAEDAPTFPSISTYDPYAITTVRARTGGYLIWDGGEAITAKGIAWAIHPDPDLTDNLISGGTGDGDFIVTIDGLTPNTIYYVRAYVTNSVGTRYGTSESFFTSQSSIIKYQGKIVKR
jgi:hypothetical protein